MCSFPGMIGDLVSFGTIELGMAGYEGGVRMGATCAASTACQGKISGMEAISESLGLQDPQNTELRASKDDPVSHHEDHRPPLFSAIPVECWKVEIHNQSP